MMGVKKQKLPFDLQRIQKEMNISDRMVENCGITKDELKKIYDDYVAAQPFYERMRLEILSGLNEGVTGDVHSIRSRVKNPDHLIAKIIRSTYRNPARYRNLNASNYRKIVTDLIGIRIIILDKRDWRGVHNDLLTMYRNIPDRYCYRPMDIMDNFDEYTEEIAGETTYPGCAYHAEMPVCYIATSDDRKLYKDANLKLDNSRQHYRSLHYIIRYKKVYFEIQMRSLFEEGWLEFDHRMKYPNDQYNKKKQEYIGILSNLAIAADQLISFYEEGDFARENETTGDEDTFRKLNDGTVPAGDSLEDKLRHLF